MSRAVDDGPEQGGHETHSNDKAPLLQVLEGTDSRSHMHPPANLEPPFAW